MYTNYSVLMSVYFKEKPEFLRQSMESIFNQTVKTDDFVLVCDGPLNDELDSIIEEMQCKFGDVLNVVRLKQNGGLGKALNIGISVCKHDIVARMDSDDIAREDRCQKELRVLSENPEIDVVSGTVEEFHSVTEKIDARRVLPETNKEILDFAKQRNPFNHPCVMYRKSAVEAAGGYQDFYLLEDYFLWIRMLLNGSKGYNLQEPLLWMRAGSDMYNRRAGWKYVKAQIALFSYMKDKNFITYGQYIKSIFSRSIVSLVPNVIRKALFEIVVRK